MYKKLIVLGLIIFRNLVATYAVTFGLIFISERQGLPDFLGRNVGVAVLFLYGLVAKNIRTTTEKNMPVFVIVSTEAV